MVKIAVTEQHIEAGCQGDMKLCPLALALQEAGYEGTNVLPYSDYVSISFYLKYPFNATHCTIDDETLANNLNNYDAEGHLEPFEIEMPIDNKGRWIYDRD